MATHDTEIPAGHASEVAVAPPTAPPKRHWAMNLLGIALILGLCYWGEPVLAVMLISVLLAFILAPVVDLLMRVRLPRAVAAAFAVLLLMSSLAAVVYYSANQASIFLQDLPKYSGKIRQEVMRFRKQAQSLEAFNEGPERGVVNVHTTRDWTELLTHGVGSAGTIIIAASFIPFLVYFMLTWQQHVRSATVMLFPLKNRHTAYVTLGLISAMIRSFMVGNLLIGLLIGVASTVVFGILGLPFFYFAGFISGFLSLIPYMGTLLALAPPVFVGVGHLSSEEFFYVIITVLGFHVIAVNILYPKVLGNRVQLNPLAVTMFALLWAMLWGAVGLLLAIPITATAKIIFDHVDSLKPYGAWLGE
ncbi:MAG TPA: AI-2E family transporter [Terriglobales bacterium]|nr:AI-2E family transporter [Terriglobales bacterium]